MTLHDFFFSVEDDPQLRGLDMVIGDSPEDDTVVVEELVTGQKWTTQIHVKAILTDNWNRLRSLMVGTYPPNPLVFVTRIVGYFSEVSNWNKSKLGELKDRRRGNYSLEPDDPWLKEDDA